MIQKGKLARAEFTLAKIEQVNGTASPERTALLRQLIENEAAVNENRRRNYYLQHLFYTWKMIAYTVVFSVSL